jgi:hypothetical protein
MRMVYSVADLLGDQTKYERELRAAIKDDDVRKEVLETQETKTRQYGSQIQFQQY